ncbi:adenyl cyclase-associated protein [Cryptosporidium sp. chipmunk genotype I]|uniref:adenyl cyclase-associated protein n=1 Tax=Cryptosporidium sp. chipmunk genotype I TaxID=1280935 RepID=UPI00351A2E80|nr:adenyl cyclase-associated protein [Cryptosporidium sp. chipmunk genotype I]
MKAARQVVTSGSPRVELQKDTYYIENHVNCNDPITLSEGSIKNKISVRCSQNSRIIVEQKVNSIFIENCVGCIFLVNGVISSIEIVNCDDIKLQMTGIVPTISLDKSNKVNIYTSKEGKNVEVYSSKSSEMNLLFPGEEEGDWKELAIPEQFVTKYNESKGKLESVVSPLYG